MAARSVIGRLPGFHLWRRRPPDTIGGSRGDGKTDGNAPALFSALRCFPIPPISITVILLILPTVCLATQCPDYCDCRWKGGKETVECRSAALIEVPLNLESGTQVLDLGENNIQLLPKDTFIDAKLLNLQRVYLQSCRIGNIDQEAFRKLSNLVELDLSDNRLEYVPTLALREVPSLRKLTLAHNPIKVIPNGALAHAQALTLLDLSNCQITEVDSGAFANLVMLTQLRLDSNRLGYLSEESLQPLTALHSLELQMNPWKCDCRMRVTRQWLLRQNIPTQGAMYCEGPAKLKGQSWEKLVLDDFACEPVIEIPYPEFVVTEGANVTITCQVTANPEPSMRWVYSSRVIENMTMASGSQTRQYIIAEDGTATDRESNLTITYVSTAQSGVYRCVAENRADKVVANVTLKVIGLPKIPELITNWTSDELSEVSSTTVALILVSAACFVLVVIALCLSIIRCRRPKKDKKKPVVNHHNHVNHNSHGNHVMADDLADGMFLAGPNPVKKPPRYYQCLPTTDLDDISGLVVPSKTGDKLWSNEYVFLHDLKPISPARTLDSATLDRRKPLTNSIYTDILNLESSRRSIHGSTDQLPPVPKPPIDCDPKFATLPITRSERESNRGSSGGGTTTSSSSKPSQGSVASVIHDRGAVGNGGVAAAVNWGSVVAMRMPTRIQPIVAQTSVGLGSQTQLGGNKVVIVKDSSEQNGGIGICKNVANV